MRQIHFVGALVEDERQLDGSRHIEIVGGADAGDIALRLVVDRDGSMREAELTLELDGTIAVIGFEQEVEVDSDERLSVHLQAAEGEVDVLQRDDGDIALALTLPDPEEPGE